MLIFQWGVLIYFWSCPSNGFLLKFDNYIGKKRVPVLRMVDHPEPPRIRKTQNYMEAAAMSEKLANDGKLLPRTHRKKVAVLGGGLSGLACAKYLSDAGHQVTVYEARRVLGGKVSRHPDHF